MEVFQIAICLTVLPLQYWYYVESPDDFGPKHQIRFQVAPVVPLPC